MCSGHHRQPSNGVRCPLEDKVPWGTGTGLEVLVPSNRCQKRPGDLLMGSRETLLWDRRVEGCRPTGQGSSPGSQANEVVLSLPTGPGSPRWHSSESVTGQ